MARRAGIKQANNATTIKKTEEMPKVIRSVGATANKRLLIKRVTAIAPTTPIATPISVNFLVAPSIARRVEVLRRVEVSKLGLNNIEFAVVDLSDFDQTAERESFDFITTFDAIHDQAKPLNVLKGIYRALKPYGVYLMQDISGTSHVHNDIEHPIGTFLYTIPCMHCMTVSLAQGGEGLGAMWGEEKTREYLQKAGFSLDHDASPGA